MAKFEGTVSYVNENLLYFCTEDCITVHMGCLLAKRPMMKIPRPGQKVSVRNVHYSKSSRLYLCEGSEIIKWNDYEGSLPNGCKIYKFTELIQQFSLGIPDLEMIFSNSCKLRRYFDRLLGLSAEELMLETAQKLLSEGREHGNITANHSCLNQRLPHFLLKSVSCCRYVDIKSNSYEGFPYWSFGIHPKMERGELVIGYLYVHPEYGIPMIKDSKHNILCLIINNDISDLEPYFNSFVLLKNFVVVTEIYGDKSVPNLEYIIVDISDILVIKQIKTMYNKKMLPFEEIKTEHQGFKHSIVFHLRNKSVTKFSTQNKLECWLEIHMTELDSKAVTKHGFFCLKVSHIKSVQVFNCENVYKLYYNEELKELWDKELKRFYPEHKQYEIGEEAIFVLHVKGTTGEKKLMTVGECKLVIMQQPKEMISFRGKVKTRRFVDPVSSRTERKILLYGFGTPGVKTHCIEFSVEDSEVKTLKLYLNNWESSLIPCGLIPDMLVNVRNVVHQKGKYCKCTPLTSFEVVKYEPQVLFSTVNMFTGNETDDWGRPFYFGLGNQIPYGVVIFGEPITVEIKSVKIISKNLSIKVSVVMIVKDMYGDAKIISNCEDLLRVFLDLSLEEFSLWCKEFHNIERYDYHSFYNKTMTNGTNEFIRMLTCTFNVINKVGINKLQLCCRKLDSKPGGENSDLPLWYCLRATKMK